MGVHRKGRPERSTWVGDAFRNWARFEPSTEAEAHREEGRGLSDRGRRSGSGPSQGAIGNYLRGMAAALGSSVSAHWRGVRPWLSDRAPPEIAVGSG
jgi:hypothetical protein